jgi:hypothetical protein
MKTRYFKKRHKIITGIILFVAILLFFVPRTGKWYIVKHGHELIGRDLSIGKIRFNYFTGTLRVHDLKLYEADSKTVFISFSRLKVNFNYLPLFKNEIFVKYIILDDPYAQVLQNGDKFNFSDMMPADTTAVVADTVPFEPVKYVINNIVISRGYVNYTDEVLNHSISMNRIDLNIPGFTWNSDSTKLGVDFRFVDGGRLLSNLDINQADSTFALNLKLDSLNLDIIEPYIGNSMYISALHGYLSNDIMIRGDMRSLMDLSVRGMNHVYAFQLLDTLKRTVFSFDDLTIDIDTLLLRNNRLVVNSIELKQPFILMEMIDSTNNWLAMMKPSSEEPADTLAKSDSTASGGEGSFVFSKLSVSGGKVDFADKILRYPFNYAFDNIMLTSSPSPKMPGWIDVHMTAGLNGTGDLAADFAMNPGNTSDLDISFKIDQFRMKDADPYFRHYFGFPVSGGRMNFRTGNILRNNSLKSENSLYFRKFTLGKRTDEKAEYHIPLRLALGVMTDKDGIIDLKIPVEMEGENVKVGNVRKIIFHAIGALFIKAAVSPVNMIADIFKIDPDKLREIEMGLNGPSPDEKNMETVDILADILNEKPGLNLDLIYCLNLEKTADTLAYIKALDDYVQTYRSGYDVPDSSLVKFLAGKFPGDTLAGKSGLKELCSRYSGKDKLDARIDSLVFSQSRFLEGYLSRDKGIAAERYKIYGSTPDSIRYDEAVPCFRIYFTSVGEE